MSIEERMAQLEARLAAAAARIAQLERGIVRNGDVPTPPIPWVQPQWVPQTPVYPGLWQAPTPVWCADGNAKES